MCPDRETLSAFYDSEIESKFRIKIKDHIEYCGPCRENLTGLESCSSIINTEIHDLDILKDKVWMSIQDKLDKKDVVNLWHRRINISFPMLAAASFFVIMITAGLSTMLTNSGSGDYGNFAVTDAVTLGGESPYYFLEDEQTVNVELQLPEDAFFMISGTPRLIREVDYLHSRD
jgi:hypothetical protein